jgi:hypothetical protein
MLLLIRVAANITIYILKNEIAGKAARRKEINLFFLHYRPTGDKD